MDASVIILGFTGSIGSGCTYISSFIPTIASKYHYFKLSDIIRDELKRDGNGAPTTEQLQDKGNQLRKQNLPGYLVEALLQKLDNDEKSYDHIIIDGIKNAGEVKTLKQFPYFFLFSVQATFDTRKNRVVGEGKPFSNGDLFKKADERDRLEKDDDDGQQVKKCNYLSDFTILNDKQIKTFDRQEKNDLISDIYYKYCQPIENLKSGKTSPSTNPSNDELCMTLAYAQSKMSSCIKRKVGAIVVDIIKSKTVGQDPKKIATDIPVVISSGYNEVPIGSEKCIYKDGVEKCYRDHLQEEHAKKIIHCPACGEKLKVKTYCPFCDKEHDGFIKYCKEHNKEIEMEFKCASCGCEVFREYLPGEKDTPGKLLDICRALHAEENALLNLMRGNPSNRENLTLYVTTQPCNLCANKIVSAGIKTVVYDEPYPMEEALNVLKAGNVKTKQFQGLKSTAYFRLYQ